MLLLFLFLSFLVVVVVVKLLLSSSSSEHGSGFSTTQIFLFISCAGPLRQKGLHSMGTTFHDLGPLWSEHDRVRVTPLDCIL